MRDGKILSWRLSPSSEHGRSAKIAFRLKKALGIRRKETAMLFYELSRWVRKIRFFNLFNFLPSARFAKFDMEESHIVTLVLGCFDTELARRQKAAETTRGKLLGVKVGQKFWHTRSVELLSQLRREEKAVRRASSKLESAVKLTGYFGYGSALDHPIFGNTARVECDKESGHGIETPSAAD